MRASPCGRVAKSHRRGASSLYTKELFLPSETNIAKTTVEYTHAAAGTRRHLSKFLPLDFN